MDCSLDCAEAEIEDFGDFSELELLNGEENEAGAHLRGKSMDCPLEMEEAFLVRLDWQGFGVYAVCGPAFPLPKDVEAGIEEDAEKVRAEPRAPPITADTPVEFQERLMDGILSILAMSEHPESRAEQGLFVARVNLSKSAEIVILATAEDDLVLHVI